MWGNGKGVMCGLIDGASFALPVVATIIVFLLKDPGK